MDDRCLCCGDAVDVGVDHELVVRPVDGGVEGGVVGFDLDAVDVGEWVVEDQGVADLGGHGFADSFFFASFGDLGAVGVAEQDADGDALGCAVGEGAQ